MRCILLCGPAGSGKSTFAKTKLDHHLRLNRDQLNRHNSRSSANRLMMLFHTCLGMDIPHVLDNTNLTVEKRRPFVELASAAGFTVETYYFDLTVAELLVNNVGRPTAIPDRSVQSQWEMYAIPTPDEGFDLIKAVRHAPPPSLWPPNTEHDPFEVEKIHGD